MTGFFAVPHEADPIISAIGDHERPQLKHRFGVVLAPVNSVPLQTHVDHSPNAAFDRAAPQCKTETFEERVRQATRVAVTLKVTDLREDLFILVVFVRVLLKFFHDVTLFAVAKTRTQIAVRCHAIAVRKSQRLQSQ